MPDRLSQVRSRRRSDRFVGTHEPAELSVVVVNYNTARLLQRCLDALRGASEGLAVQVVVVDNASRDGSVAWLRARFADCTLIENRVNVGFGRANNQALAHCTAPLVLLLNSDAFVFADTLRRSLAHMRAHPGCGVLGARTVDAAGRGVPAARQFPNPWRSFVRRVGLFRRRYASLVPAPHRSSDAVSDCDWVVGCYYLVRRAVIDQVGLFDPRYFLYFEEVDHCRAVKDAGWAVHCARDVRVEHVGGGSAQREEGYTPWGRQIEPVQIESELLYFRKHAGIAGALTSAALAVLADAIVALKQILKARPPREAAVFLAHAANVCRLAVRTRCGARSTR